MQNYITVKLNGGSEYEQDIYITKGEAMALSCKGNGAFQNKIWEVVAERINWREQMVVNGGAFQIVSYTVNGITRAWH